ncbi:MAG: DUF4242 domain-containing protein [Geothrix sp.]|nr:DUF4242 domain-containing protein [Geothrix sp.]
MPVRTPTLLVLAALTVLPTSLEARSPKAAPTAAADTAPAVPAPRAGMRRFMVVRTFPAGALAGLDATAKKAVNQCNSTHKVEWVHSYANADKTKTFCIYDGPSEQAIRDAATANKIPVDDIIEIPVVLKPQ